MSNEYTKEQKTRRRRRRKPKTGQQQGKNRPPVEEAAPIQKAPTLNTWRIKTEQDGGREQFIDGNYYHFGDILPKLRYHLFTQLRSDGYIEVVEAQEVEQ